LNNTNPIRNLEWTRLLRKGKQFIIMCLFILYIISHFVNQATLSLFLFKWLYVLFFLLVITHFTLEIAKQDNCPRYNRSSILLCPRHYYVQQFLVSSKIQCPHLLLFNIWRWKPGTKMWRGETKPVNGIPKLPSWYNATGFQR
jgi:hypothetical protein